MTDVLPYDKNSWGTPPHILDAVREAFGGQIDCDPASNAKAQERVRAGVWYGPENLDNTNDDWGGPDGVSGNADWVGSVFLNPPYGKGLVSPFAEMLKTDWYLAGQYPRDCGVNISAHAVLVNLDPSTEWFRTFESCSTHLVNLGRVAFLHPDTGLPVRGNSRSQCLLVRNVNLEPLRKLGSVYARA